MELFHRYLVELASRADFGDREDEWVGNMFMAYMSYDKIAEELLAETKLPQDAYENAIRREKGIEHRKTMKTNPFGAESPQTYQRNRSRWATFNHAGEVFIKICIKTNKEVEEITRSTPRSVQPRGQKNQQTNKNKTGYNCGRI